MIMIKHLSLATAAAVLSCSLMVAGCSAVKSSSSKIDGTSPWFDYTAINTNDIFDTTGLASSSPEYVGMCGDNYVIHNMGNLPIPADFDYEKDDYYSYSKDEIDTVSPDGKIISSVNTYDIIDENSESVDKLSVDGTDIIVSILVWSNDNSSHRFCRINSTDGTVTQMSDSDAASETDAAAESSGDTVEGSYQISGYKVDVLSSYDAGTDKSSYTLSITGADGKTASVPINSGSSSVYGISAVLGLGGGNALVETITDGDNGFYTLDLAAGTLTEAAAEDYSWLTDSVDVGQATMIPSDDGNVYLKSNDGIAEIDAAGKKVDEVFSYNDCYYPRSDLESMAPISFNGDKIVYAGSCYHSGTYDNSGVTNLAIVTLTRAAENPNAGKQEIKLYSSGGDSWYLSQTIVDFNKKSTDYLITYDDRYNSNEYYNNASGDDDYLKTINSSADLSGQLAIDIINGDGPDILLDTGNMPGLDSSDYLIDLSSVVSGLGDGYFSNVFECARSSDGKLYQLPTSVAVKGILTDTKNVADGQKGFTYDQYAAFVSSVCNGTDPMQLNQINFVIECFNQSGDLYYDNGDINFGGDAFASLAAYAKDHVNNQPADGGDTVATADGGDDSNDTQAASYMSISDIGQFLNCSYHGVYGAPSYDGRGPALDLQHSIAVSAQTGVMQGCLDFVNMFMSEDTQELYGNNGVIPVSKAAFSAVAEDAFTYYSENSNNGGVVYDSGSGTTVSHDDIGVLEGVIGQIDHCARTDPSVDKIIYEEMPSYLSGQKSIEDVANVMGDRVQTVLNERK